ncbi:MAG TPA: S8 family serine peptidase, partial [Actinomycetota bacterium]|nr:S8 family serine peptidase [Actinomycetota bacterium]
HLAAPGDDILSTWPAYQIIRAADGFDDSADSSFDSRWGDRTFTTGDQLWGRTTLHKDSGTHSLTDSPVGNYTDNTRTTMRLLPPVSLTGQVGCRVAYDILLDTEFLFDPFLVLTGTTTATPTVAGGWWGSSGGRFFPLSSDLSMMDGQGTVYVRLGLQSDGSDTFDGVYVDDLSVECVDHSGSAYDAISGTSMASPHVAGVAALALAQNPALTTLELKGRLLSAVDVLPQLAGSVSTSGRLNACRALVGCIPTSPPQPPQPPRPPADTIGPIDPVVSSPSHTVGVPSRNRVIQFRWSGASDVGSGVDGFSFHIDQSAVSTPDRIKDAEENIASMTTAPLPNGRYYFHLSTVDNAGNWTNTRHFGPIIISVPRTGSGVQCRVPDVRGKTLARSRQLLTRANCRLGAVRRVYSGRMRSGRVVSQSRRPGARLPRWTRINVKVSRGRGR